GPHLEAEELFEVTAQCFDSFHERFGIRYPFGDTYDQLWVPEFNHGGMENAGAVTFTEDLLFRSKVTDADRRQRAMVIAHEMAHMWFGNLVTMRWFDDLWLNESFAELMGFFTTDRATRFEGGWLDFCTGRKAWGYSADQKPTTHPISGEVADNRTALLNFDGISYAKGASVLRQLMAWLGEEVFFEGVRRYLTRHAFGNTSLADFLAALEEVSGRDLEQWTESWLRTPGVSTLRVEQGAVVQTAPAQYPVLRDHRIRIGRYALDDGVLVAAEPLEVEVSGARTPVDGLAAHDLVLLNDGDLTFAKIRFDDRSLGTVVDHLWKLPDPLARALCWSSLYDAARDAELPARVLVQAVLNNAEGETDTGVVENLLAQSRLAATAWTTDAALGRALAEKARHVLTRTEPGSGLQLVWAKGWVSITDDTAALRALLDAPPAGIAVDTELRWHLLRRLAVLGALDDADIVAEEERDRTAAGQRHACYARAARPDAASKAAAWERVLRDRSLSNHQTEAYSQGFWQHASVSVTAPWVERYFDEIRALWEEHGPEVARRVAHFLYPSTHVSPEVLARADAFLADDSLPPGLRRVVLEQQDELRRAVAARKLS
ncbi:MAG: Aminopeptidase, partial [Frankiales bacterium]|nr:Aminopeptidase [Frankiales bacterium]